MPDFYQGCELWDLSLVDPDNRRPVDFGARQAMLAELQGSGRPLAPLLASLMRTPEDGRIKLHVTQRALALRRARRPVFDQGRYDPLTATGPAGEHVVAFARARGEAAIVVVVGRHLHRLSEPGRLPVGEVWRDSRLLLSEALSRRRFRDVLSDTVLDPGARGLTPSLPLAAVFAHLPVALLEAL